VKIRRQDIGGGAGCKATSVAALIRQAIERREPIHVTGLGTMVRSEGDDSKAWTYRLTLTAAVAKDLAGFPDHQSLARRANMFVDVLHLARALGAPVEVWAPAGVARRSADVLIDPIIITTVQP